MLRPRQYNFLAALEYHFKGQPAYLDRKTLLGFCDKYKGQQGPLGYTIRWCAWLTYNQSAGSPYKTLRRGVFRLPWEEYNNWKATKIAAKVIEEPTQPTNEL
ncbi:MAG: hypothetical protein JW384_00887 [Nitrosomonadaceae bacterium]|nr:hypothetical protein [Nitrosomonadaceae bacterium]